MADRSDSRPWRAGLLALALLTAVVVLVEGRGETFYYDEWDFLLGRRGHDAGAFLDAQNGNLSLAPIVLFKLLLQVFGTEGYPAWRVVLLLLHLAVVALTWLLLRRRLGEAGATVGAGLVLVLGRSADNLIWPAQFGYVMAAIGGLVALVGVQRRSTRGDLLVLAGLTLGLASSSNALPFYVAVVVTLVLRRGEWRRLWAALVPAFLYGLWSAAYGESQLDVANVPKLPEFAARMAATAASGAFGLPDEAGWAIGVLLVAALATWLVRGGRATPMLWGGLAGLLALWVITALARASIEVPTAPRYIYAAVILGVLVAGEAFAAGREGRPEGLTAAAIDPYRARVGVVVLVGACAILGWGALHQEAKYLRGRGEEVKAILGSVTLAAGYIQPGYRPVPAQPQVIAGPLLDVQRDFGQIGDTRRELATADASDRAAADDALRRAGALVLTAGGRRAGTQPPAVVGLSGVSQRLVTGVPCSELTPGSAGASAEVAALPGQRLELETTQAAPLRAGRFAPPPSGISAVAPTGRSTLALQPDSVAGDPVRPWVVQIAVERPLRVCIGG